MGRNYIPIAARRLADTHEVTRGFVVERANGKPNEARPRLTKTAGGLLRDREALEWQGSEVAGVELDGELCLGERLLHHADRTQVAHRAALEPPILVRDRLVCIRRHKKVRSR